MRDPRRLSPLGTPRLQPMGDANDAGVAVQRRPRPSVSPLWRRAAGLSLLALVLVGCSAPGTAPGGGDDACARAVAAYELYQASQATGREISKDERNAAAIAAAYLQLRCGWTPAATRDLPSDPEVPVLRPPSSP